jgi:hypothetical protein
VGPAVEAYDEASFDRIRSIQENRVEEQLEAAERKEGTRSQP